MPRKISNSKYLKKAIEEGLSYEKAKDKYGIRIRKQTYLALKKVATEGPLTERQREEIGRLLSKEDKYKDIIKEFELKDRVKKVYIGEGDVILSTSKHTGEATEIYSEVVINATVKGNVEEYKDKEEFLEGIEYNLYRAYKESLLELFNNDNLVEALPIRVDTHEDFSLREEIVLDYEVKDKKSVIKSGILFEDYTSLVVDKKYKRKTKSYEYSSELLDLITEELENRDWDIKVIKKKKREGEDGGN